MQTCMSVGDSGAFGHCGRNSETSLARQDRSLLKKG